VEKELEDRYGPVPAEVKNLLEYSALKSVAEKLGIEHIDRRHSLVNIKFYKETRIDPGKLMNLVSRTRGAQFTPAGILLVPLDGATAPADILNSIRGHMVELQP